MRLIPCDIKTIDSRLYHYTDNMRVIMEFANSNLECAKIADYRHAQCYSCASALNHCLDRMNMPQFKAIVRKKEVYLIRVNSAE